MKLRSFLLIACMVMVPAVAMFSHKVPAGARASIRSQLWIPVASRVATALGVPAPAATPRAVTGASTGAAAPPTASPGEADAKPSEAVAPPPPPSAALDARPTPVAAAGGASGIGSERFAGEESGRASRDVAGGDPPRATVVEAVAVDLEPALLAADAAARPMSGGGQTGASGDVATLESRLRALGATAIEWTPAQGGDGLHRCSCRIPAEPTGQLHRVFQASATDPLTALDSLVGQVTAWSMRDTGASRSAPAAGPLSERH